MTGPQAAMLARLREAGPLVFNGRATRTIDALERAGLVRVDWDADLDEAKGRLRWRITVIAADDRRTMYVHRTRGGRGPDGREGWTRVPARRALAEMIAWREAGWTVRIVPSTPAVRAQVAAWEARAKGHPGEASGISRPNR